MSDSQPDPDRVQRILEARAQALARPLAVDAPGDMLELVVLAVGPDRYGVAADQVQEIQVLTGLTRVPGLPAFWAGVVNLHGRLYPVLNLRRYLDLPGAAPEQGSKLALVLAAGLSVALWVDDVPEVRQVPVAAIGPTLVDAAANAKVPVVRGVTPDLLAVLNLETLLADTRLVVQDEIR